MHRGEGIVDVQKWWFDAHFILFRFVGSAALSFMSSVVNCLVVVVFVYVLKTVFLCLGLNP